MENLVLNASVLFAGELALMAFPLYLGAPLMGACLLLSGWPSAYQSMPAIATGEALRRSHSVLGDLRESIVGA